MWEMAGTLDAGVKASLIHNPLDFRFRRARERLLGLHAPMIF